MREAIGSDQALVELAARERWLMWRIGINSLSKEAHTKIDPAIFRAYAIQKINDIERSGNNTPVPDRPAFYDLMWEIFRKNSCKENVLKKTDKTEEPNGANNYASEGICHEVTIIAGQAGSL